MDRMVRLDDPDVIGEQYRDPARLAARQAIWAFRRPAIDFVSWALGHVDLDGDETVVDVGCGNGQYLCTLLELGHRGHLVGVDISTGMLAAVPSRAGRVGADAQALPIADSAAALTLAMHMLYHVPDKQKAVSELRRVTKPHGRVVVSLPDRQSLHELHQLIEECASRLDLSIAPDDPGLGFDEATSLLAGLFETVRRIDVPGVLQVTEARPVVDYTASLSRVVRATPLPGQHDDLLDRIGEKVTARIAVDGAFTLTAAGGCLICQ
jgi:SAM-dependent methyltransferase